MNCPIELVHAYHDGQLQPARVAEVEAHLSDCADCRDLLADLKKVSALVAAAPMAEPTPHAATRMQQAWWAARAAQERGVRRVASWLTAAAAAVMLAAMVWSPAPQRTETVVLAPDLLLPPTTVADEPQDETIDAAQWIADDLALAMR